MREASGGDFTAKDFRTWAGTVLAYRALRALQPGDRRAWRAKRNVVEAIRRTADRLGNTPAVARGSYVHPAVLEAYLDGVDPRARSSRPPRSRSAHPGGASRAEESAVMDLLRQRLDAGADRARPTTKRARRPSARKTQPRRTRAR